MVRQFQLLGVVVGDIPDCLHVPRLENDLLSVPRMDVAMGWRTTFGKGKCVIEDVNMGTVKYFGVLDRGIMLYVVPVSQVLGSSVNRASLDASESREQALYAITKGEYVNRLHDIFGCHDRRLEALVKSGVVNWPFNAKKIKPIMFKNCLLPCDACGIAKTMRVSFRVKRMTNLKVGSVWQTNISGKWVTLSLQGNTYIIGFLSASQRRSFCTSATPRRCHSRRKTWLCRRYPCADCGLGLQTLLSTAM